MKDYQIYKKLSPFIFKRMLYALLGFVLILGFLALATHWGMQFPEYRVQIIFLCAVIGVFIGWKIIRKGESRYRLAQVAMITDIVQGHETSEITSKYAMQRVKSTFKYVSIINLIKNIWRHKNFKKIGQFITVMAANLIPYVGTCMMSWIFAHPQEKKLPGACHAITNYYSNRRKLRPKLLKAFLKEIGLVVLAFMVIFAIEFAIYFFVVNYFMELDDILDKLESFTDTLELVYDWYFEDKGGYTWSPLDVMTIIAIYIAWFVKVFSIRAYQMIAIIREYLILGEENPPSDELYNRLMLEWEKNTAKKEKKQKKGQSTEEITDSPENTTENQAENTTENTIENTTENIAENAT